MRRRVAIAFCAWAGLGLSAAYASGVYVVRFNTGGAPTIVTPPCTYLAYRDDLVFYNTGATDATIGLLDVSNGVAAHPVPLKVEPGTATSSEGDGAVAAASWAPDPQPLLWVAHIDVPDQVQVVSRLLVPVGTPQSCNGFPDTSGHTYAGIAMPVVRSLLPAGVPQIHLATDIGGDKSGSDDGRTNVGIYNGGSVSAVARAELRRACDDGVLESRTGVIPPNTVIQVNGFSEVFAGCTAFRAAPYETYVVVTVDQPSFSYAVTLSNQRPPLIPVSSSP